MSVGTELRLARERAGLTTEQVGERIKIQPLKLQSLEAGEFESLPHGIYLDGIIRAYAREVSVDPEPLVEQVRDEHARFFNDLYATSTNLDGFQSEDASATQPPSTPPVQVVSPETTPPIQAELTEWVAPAHVEAVERVPPVHVEPAPDVTPIHIDPPHATVDRTPVTTPSSRVVGDDDLPDLDVVDRRRTYGTPVALDMDTDPALLRAEHQHVQPARDPARGARGLGMLALTLSLIAALGWGAYLYQGRDAFDGDETADAAVSDSPGERPAEAPQPSTASPPSTSIAPSGTAPAEPMAISASPVAPAESIGTAGSIPDIAGSWSLATQLESTSYARFAGLRLGYELQLQQSGDRVTGAGRKVTENDGPLRRRAQTPISVAGTIEGDRLTLTFTERGIRRPTEGKFVLLLNDDGTMRGRFSSSAAKSSGTVEAKRVN